MNHRMTAQLAVDALANACALRCPAGTTVHSDGGSQFVHTPSSAPCANTSCRAR
jgi:hypothetical protein